MLCPTQKKRILGVNGKFPGINIVASRSETEVHKTGVCITAFRNTHNSSFVSTGNQENDCDSISGFFAESLYKKSHRGSCAPKIRQCDDSFSDKQNGSNQVHGPVAGHNISVGYCLSNKITITVEHLPGAMNQIEDRKGRDFNDSSNWKLLKMRVMQPVLFPPDHNILAISSRRTTPTGEGRGYDICMHGRF